MHFPVVSSRRKHGQWIAACFTLFLPLYLLLILQHDVSQAQSEEPTSTETPTFSEIDTGTLTDTDSTNTDTPTETPIALVTFTETPTETPTGTETESATPTETVPEGFVADHITNQIILRYKSTSKAFSSPQRVDQMERVAGAAGVALEFRRLMTGGAVVLRFQGRKTNKEIQSIVDKIKKLPEVEYAEPDRILVPTRDRLQSLPEMKIRPLFFTPNDPYFSYQWDFSEAWGIDAGAAWDTTTGSASGVVAVIDTGLTNHAEFAGRTVAGYDFITEPQIANDGDGRDADPGDPGDWITAAESASGFFAGCPVEDSSWHGTHTAGTIGATGQNGMGVAGIDWNAKILPVRVLGKCGGYMSDIIEGMRWAAGLSVSGVPANANPAKVLSISLGGAGACATAMQTAVNDILAAGSVVVVAAGNSNADASGFVPANCSGVITVAATDRNGYRAYYSNYGASVEISAPGGDVRSSAYNGILSTLNTGTQGPLADAYAFYQGTSMAAPHISGVVSLLFAIKPTLTPAEVLSTLQTTAKAFPGGGSCTTANCGSGIVNAGAAVAALLAVETETPTPTRTETETTTPTPSATATATDSPTATLTLVPTLTETPTETETDTPTASVTSTATDPPTPTDTQISVLVTVVDTDGNPVEAGVNVTAYSGGSFSHHEGFTDESGQAWVAVPPGAYQFRVVRGGTAFYSGTGDHCAIPGCTAATIVINLPVTVTVLNLYGRAEAGVSVMAFDGTTYSGYSGTTNALGQVSFTMPDGNYRFRAFKNNRFFWSGASNHCAIPGCATVTITVDNTVVVTVLDSEGNPEVGLNVLAYNGSTYTGYAAYTNAQGQAILSLPGGNYRFRVAKNGTAFWSGTANHCRVPGCAMAGITVNLPVVVTVLNLESQPEAGLTVQAYSGSTWAGYTATTSPQGRVSFTLPDGDYRFRVYKNSRSFWSGTTDHCSIPGCYDASVTVDNSVVVTVLDSEGHPENGINVQAYNGSTFAGFSMYTDGQGQAVMALPAGEYRFRVVKGGTSFWSGASNHCPVPGCSAAAITTALPVTVTVLNLDGQAEAGLSVMAYSGATYAGYSGTTNAQGQVSFTMPMGSYRFRASKANRFFWSGAVNHCTVPGCTVATVTVDNLVVITVLDNSGNPQAGLNVLAYDGSTYAGFAAYTNAQGQASLALPPGNYRFRVAKNGTAFWSGSANHCAIPGCTSAGITTTAPVIVTVLDSLGQPETGLTVQAFDGSTYAGLSAVTNAQGQASLTLPGGNYRFRTIKGGGIFWSGPANHCAVPGCTDAGITTVSGGQFAAGSVDGVHPANYTKVIGMLFPALVWIARRT
jgi:serine protease